MELVAVSDESLFREVDEEVRQEQYKKLWDKFGNYFVALCFVIVASVAGVKGYQLSGETIGSGCRRLFRWRQTRFRGEIRTLKALAALIIRA
jgi:hypothetical protein